MARRNQNTFLKRQKEMERVRKAKEKMDRRHGKKSKEEEPVGFAVYGEPPRTLTGAPRPESPLRTLTGSPRPESPLRTPTGLPCPTSPRRTRTGKVRPRLRPITDVPGTGDVPLRPSTVNVQSRTQEATHRPGDES